MNGLRLASLADRSEGRRTLPTQIPHMKLLPFFSVFAFTACVTLAADWPQWRGKDRKDHSPDTATLVPWPANGPNRLWLHKEAGAGYSGFSIAAGQLFTMCAKDDAEQVLSLDIKTGERRWLAILDERVYPNKWGDGPRSTPTIDGDRAYALSGNGMLGCLAIKDGAILWKVDLVKDFGGKLQNW